MTKIFTMGKTEKNVAAIAAMLALSYGNKTLERNNSLSLIHIADSIERLVNISQEMDKVRDEVRKLLSVGRYDGESVRAKFLDGRERMLRGQANILGKLLACQVEVNDIESHSSLWLRIPLFNAAMGSDLLGAWPLYERHVSVRKTGIEKGKPPIEKVSPL